MQNFTARHILLSALFIASSQSHATLVTVSFGGDVWQVYDPVNPLGLTPGATYTMSFTYDDSTPDSNPDPVRGTFNQALTSWTYTFSNGVVLNLDTSQANQMNLTNWTTFSRIGALGNAQLAYGAEFYFDYSDEYFYTGSANTLTDLVPENGWNRLGGAYINQISVITTPGQTNPQVIKLARYNNFTVTPSVPVPTAAWLFSSSLLSFAGSQSRRRRKVTI